MWRINLRKTFLPRKAMLLLIAVYFFCAAAFFFISYSLKHDRTEQILKLVLILISLIAFCLLQLTSYLKKVKCEIQRLRIERHDFIKHISIIHALASNSELDELLKYISTLSSDTHFKSSLNKLNCPALAALFTEKEKLVFNKNVKFDLSVKSSLEKLKIKTTDLCTLIGNLVDNAIESTEKLSENDRFVGIDIYNHQNYLVFSVSNNGGPIKVKNIDLLFEPGYTTKTNKEGHGMGLYIVSSILKKYNGSIEISNDDKQVVFTVYLPT